MNNNPKSRFLVFIFSFIPGAGEMYLGALKKGMVITGTFFGIFILSDMIGNGIFLVGMPVVWLYSFFDTIQMKHMSREEIKENEDKFIGNITAFIGGDAMSTLGRNKALIGYVMILIGVFAMFNIVLRRFLWLLIDIFPWAYEIFNMLPSLLVAVLLIIFGVKLVKGKEEANKDFMEYKGGGEDEV